MIALTKEKREELIGNYTKYIEWCNERLSATLIDFDRAGIESSKLMAEIALASLTAEKRATVDVVGVIWNEWKPEVGTPLFTAPPVPEIKLPDIKSEYAENEEWIDCSVSYRRGKEDGHNDLLAEIKLLNGLGE